MKRIVLLTLVLSVVFTELVGGQEIPKQPVRSSGAVVESGCYFRPAYSVDTIRVLDGGFFGEGDCVRISYTTKPTAVQAKNLIDKGWYLGKVRGYADTPEEGCLVAREFMAALVLMGWEPAFGFHPECHHNSSGLRAVELFFWKDLFKK